jgi:TPR repeat protein
MMLNGEGVDQNTAAAIDFYTKAAAAGVREAQLALDQLGGAQPRAAEPSRDAA